MIITLPHHRHSGAGRNPAFLKIDGLLSETPAFTGVTNLKDNR
jgi:hypothetical protein